MELGPHAAFILTAYAAAAVIVATLIAWIALDYRAQRNNLSSLEARGVTRRSVRMSKETT